LSGQKIVVIKIGGKGAETQEIVGQVCRLVHFFVRSCFKVVIVHGGGQALTSLANRLDVKSEFIAGRRVTDDQLIELAKMSFVGKVGTDMAAWMHAEGLRPVPLSGVSAGTLQVTRREPQKVGQALVDYGWVGDISKCDTSLLQTLLDHGYVPLVASLGVDKLGQVFNINADTVACSLATALDARELLILMDQEGLYRDLSDQKSLIPQLSVDELSQMVAEGSISGGMLPKIDAMAKFLNSKINLDETSSGFPRRVRLMSWNGVSAFEQGGSYSRGTVIYKDLAPII
jgi:acetylglutamate kinase